MNHRSITTFCISLLFLLGNAQNDLPAFSLKGSVTKVTPNQDIQTYSLDNYALGFSETGKLVSFNGEGEMYERDKKGRISKFYFDDGCSMGYDTIIYDNHGKVIQTNSFVYIEAGYNEESGKVEDGRYIDGGCKKYYYDADGNISKVLVFDAYNSTSNTINYTYRTIDKSGNWTERVANCPKLGLNNQLETRKLTYYKNGESAQSILPENTSPDSLDTTSNDIQIPQNSRKLTFWEVFFSVLLGAALLFMIGYMIYILLIRDRKLVPKTLDDFKTYRQTFGLPDESSETENERVPQLFDIVYQNLTVKKNNQGGEDELFFTTKEQIETLRSTLVEIQEIAPTQPEYVDLYNEMLAEYKTFTKRQFMGSKTYLIIGGILTVLMSIGGGLQAIPFMLLNILGYYFASKETQFMINAKNIKGTSSNGRSKVMTALMMMGIGVLFSGQTYKTVTKWSDGTTSTDYDNSEHLIALIIGLIIIAVLSFFMFVVAMVNFVRNYLIYK